MNLGIPYDIIIYMDEVIVTNENDEIIGTIQKSEAHKNGTLHRIVVVYLENDKEEILVQHRADGYLDHSAAGHVDIGESYEEAGYRELFEELGVKDIKLEYIGHGMTKDEIYPGGKRSSHIFDIFKCKAEPGELQVDEVSNVYWAKPEEILKDMKSNEQKYCGGFLVSLLIYIKHLDNKS